MATLPALAQGSGIKGKVVSRGDRAAIEQVKITLTPGERQATSDAEGRFRFDDVASGDYTLTFEADDYEPLEIKVRVDKPRETTFPLMPLPCARAGSVAIVRSNVSKCFIFIMNRFIWQCR